MKYQSQTVRADYLTKVGKIILVATPDHLLAVYWDYLLEDTHSKIYQEILALPKDSQNTVVKQTIVQLDEYFSQERKKFDLPIQPVGSDFQKKVWRALLDISHGQTVSYKQQAEALGNPKMARAVGTANGKNPLSIVLPCHRVVTASGQLGGYAGGVEAKRFLLRLEGSWSCCQKS